MFNLQTGIALLITFLLLKPLSAGPTAQTKQLSDHTIEFRQEVIEVVDGVHVAIGYGLANSILIEGDGGLIVVDTMESPIAAKAVKAEFDKISTDPVKALIYTHNHYDHVYGAKEFAGETPPDVYAQAKTMAAISVRNEIVQQAIFQRSMRQFGITLPEDQHINCGIGQKLVMSPTAARSFLPPTHIVEDRMEVTIAGVDIVLVHAPGETDDQLYVWLPEKKVLLCGDNYYHAFPNLYAIRGTMFRDVAGWIKSLDMMIAEAPEHLVPSHTRPISGADKIKETLTAYRDAIDSIYLQTIAAMNRGLTVDEVVESVKLDPELAAKPFLQPYYGTVDWSVRSIFHGYLGWFDGNATNLFPLPPAEKAKKMIDLVGSTDALRTKAESAYASGDWQWAMELNDNLLALDSGDRTAKELKARCCVQLGRRQLSANGRNYYLTTAMQLAGRGIFAKVDAE